VICHVTKPDEPPGSGLVELLPYVVDDRVGGRLYPVLLPDVLGDLPDQFFLCCT
jgi:hypothetical protein